jgi:hypothetical protein
MIQWLHFAAAPTFAAMAITTGALDGSAPNALCSAVGGSALGGMAPMYLLMALFHLTPWLKLILRRGCAVTLFGRLDRSGDVVRTMEQKS